MRSRFPVSISFIYYTVFSGFYFWGLCHLLSKALRREAESHFQTHPTQQPTQTTLRTIIKPSHIVAHAGFPYEAVTSEHLLAGHLCCLPLLIVV